MNHKVIKPFLLFLAIPKLSLFLYKKVKSRILKNIKVSRVRPSKPSRKFFSYPRKTLTYTRGQRSITKHLSRSIV